jgi:hypothetical protein
MGIQSVQTRSYRFPESALDAVPYNGLAHGSRHRKANVRTASLGFPYAERRKKRIRVTGSLVIDSSEILRTQQADTFRETSDGGYLSELTVSFLRPRARRRDNTARPFLVSMRLRKPWVLARRLRLG